MCECKHCELDQEFSKCETVGFPSDKAWRKAPPHPSLVYLLHFVQSLDAYMITIMLCDPVATRQLGQNDFKVHKIA